MLCVAAWVIVTVSKGVFLPNILGGTDYASGIVANPAVGVMWLDVGCWGLNSDPFRDIRVNRGRTSCCKRAQSPEIARRIFSTIKWWECQSVVAVQDIREGNPSPNSIAGRAHNPWREITRLCQQRRNKPYRSSYVNGQEQRRGFGQHEYPGPWHWVTHECGSRRLTDCRVYHMMKHHP